MDLPALRAATAEDHDRTEAAVPLASPELTREQYARTVRRMQGFVRGWEQWAAQHAPEDLRPLLEERQRSGLLEQDLETLGETASGDVAEMPFLAEAAGTRAAFLGGLYVMEGSTLGGQYIASFTEKHFGFEHGVGNAYFVGYGPRTGARWNEVRAVLKAVPDAEAGAVTAAARSMFAAFGAWMGAAAARETEVTHG